MQAAFISYNYNFCLHLYFYSFPTALSNQSGFIMDGGLILHPFKIQNLHNLPAKNGDRSYDTLRP